MGEIIPFLVWIIPFPVLTSPFPVVKINFEFLGRYGEDVIKEVF